MDRRGFTGVLGAATAGYLCYQGLVVTVPYALLERGTASVVVGLSTFLFMAAATVTPFALIGRMGDLGLTSALALCALAIGTPALLEVGGNTVAVITGAAARGAAFGMLSLVTAVAVVALAPVNRTGAWLGIYGFATSVAAVIGQPAGLELLERYGAESSVLLLGLLPLVGLVPFVASRRLRSCASIVEVPDREPGVKVPLRRALNPLVGIAAVTAVLGVMVTFGGSVTARSGSVSPSLFFFLIGVSIPLGRLIAGYAADHGARASAGYIMPHLAVATALGLMAFDGLVAIALAVPVIFGLGAGLSISRGQIELIRKRLFSSVHQSSAWFGAAWNIPMGIGALAAGAAGGFWSQHTVLVACCVVPIAGAVAAWWLGRETEIVNPNAA